MAQGKSKRVPRTPRVRQPTPTTQKLAAAASGDHPWVEMLIDPIGAPAAQIPDMWQYPTQATKLKMVVDVQTDAAGYYVASLCHSMNYFIRKFTVTSGLIVGTPADTGHTDRTAYNVAFEKARITCGGVEFVSFLTPETSMGMCGFAEMIYESALSYVGLSPVELMSDGVMATVEEGISTFMYPMEEPVFNAGADFTPYFPVTMFTVKGAKASTIIGQLTLTINLEGVADPSSVHSGGSTVEPYDVGAHTVGTHVTQTTPAARTIQGSSRRLTTAGRAIADTSAAMLGYSLGGYGGAAVANAPAVYRELRKKLKQQMSSQPKRGR